VAAMRLKHPEIKNPYSLAWYMRNKGDKLHYENTRTSKVNTVPKKKKTFQEWLSERDWE
jgi:hypothetical protein